jgi:hypothetical protein
MATGADNQQGALMIDLKRARRAGYNRCPSLLSKKWGNCEIRVVLLLCGKEHVGERPTVVGALEGSIREALQ